MRPVVALDLDGVLNPSVCFGDYVEHAVTIPADLIPESRFVRQPAPGAGGLELEVRASLRLGAWVNALSEHAEVVWASTWEHAANTVYAPLAGIEPLRVVEHHCYKPRFSDSPADWKAHALIDEFAGRPLCWVDDRAWGYNGTAWRYADTATLVVVPDPRTGIVAEHRDAIEAFIAEHRS